MNREEERNLSDRNIHPRDSGIAGSFVHDNTINESSSSKEEEERVNQDFLGVIHEENPSSSDNKSENTKRRLLNNEYKSSPLSYANSGDIFIYNSTLTSETSQIFTPIFKQN